jgi:hypothetical protein
MLLTWRLARARDLNMGPALLLPQLAMQVSLTVLC